MPNSPLLYGPGNKAINLQEGMLQPSGMLNNMNGPKNYIGNGSFENGLITGWQLGITGGLANGIPTSTPTFGSGYAGTVSIATIASTLSGTYMLSLVNTTNVVVGNMVSNTFTIDPSDQAKVLTYKFNYNTSVGATNNNYSGTAANTFAVAAYDITNSVWMGVAGVFNIVQGTGNGVATGTFQTNSTTSQIALCVYVASTNLGATTFNIDDVFVGPQTSPMAPAMSDWVAYTPTIVGFGTPTVNKFVSRRIGDSLEILGKFTPGTTTGTVATVTLGFNGANGNVSIDTTKIATGSSTVGVSGTATVGAVSLLMLTDSTAPTVLKFGVQAASSSAISYATGSGVSSSGMDVEFVATVPIVGWSSNSVASSDTDTRVVAMQVNQASPTATIVAGASVVKFTSTPLQDTHGGFSTATGGYTVPVTGYYRLTFSVSVNATYAANNYCNSGFGINSTSSITYGGQMRAASSSTTGLVPTSVATIYCNAGTIIYPLAQSNGTSPTIGADATANFFMLERVSGPAVITATESVNMRYYSSATAVSGTLATVMYSTKAWDTHAAYNAATGIYTAPVSGKYQVNASIAMTGTFILNSTLDLQVQQTGSATQTSESKSFSGGAVTQMNTNVGDIFYMQAGDQLKVQVSNSGTTPVIAATTTQNWLSLSRVGN